jgi:hypothetical protein
MTVERDKCHVYVSGSMKNASRTMWNKNITKELGRELKVYQSILVGFIPPPSLGSPITLAPGDGSVIQRYRCHSKENKDFQCKVYVNYKYSFSYIVS